MTVQTNSSLIIKLREQLLKRGAAGIKGIGRMWSQIDDDFSRYLSFKEFHDGLINHNVIMTSDEITQLFKEFDQDGSGQISYDEFLMQLRVIE
jgi:Ca2+-binding EF-hand superfamily protein